MFSLRQKGLGVDHSKPANRCPSLPFYQWVKCLPPASPQTSDFASKTGDLFSAPANHFVSDTLMFPSVNDSGKS